MLLRRFPIAAAAVCCAFLFALLVSAAPQAVDRETYARDYVQFLVLQLDQWSKEFPQQFYLSMMRPPVDATKLSEGAKNGAGELGDALRTRDHLAGRRCDAARAHRGDFGTEAVLVVLAAGQAGVLR